MDLLKTKQMQTNVAVEHHTAPWNNYFKFSNYFENGGSDNFNLELFNLCVEQEDVCCMNILFLFCFSLLICYTKEHHMLLGINGKE